MSTKLVSCKLNKPGHFKINNSASDDAKREYNACDCHPFRVEVLNNRKWGTLSETEFLSQTQLSEIHHNHQTQRT